MKRVLIGLLVAAVAAIGFGTSPRRLRRTNCRHSEPSGHYWGGRHERHHRYDAGETAASTSTPRSTTAAAPASPSRSCQRLRSGGHPSSASQSTRRVCNRWGYAFLDAAGCGGVTGGWPSNGQTSLANCHVNSWAWTSQLGCLRVRQRWLADSPCGSLSRRPSCSTRKCIDLASR